MGKFSEVLIASDYDNSLVYTEGTMTGGCGKFPTISPENRAAIEYFIANSGTFCVATGRALPYFSDIISTVPSNGPTILANGAVIYDFLSQKTLYTSFLPDSIREHIHQLLTVFPDTAMEIYHDDFSVHSLNPSELTKRHSLLGCASITPMESIDLIPFPISKILLEETGVRQQQLIEYLNTQPWSSLYEITVSSVYLIEITARNTNKGKAIQFLENYLSKSPQHTYAIGDQWNDIPMLAGVRIPFAPDNAVPAVRELPGVHLLPHCRDNAVAVMIDELDHLY